MDWALDAHGNLRAVTLRDTAFWKDATTITNWFLPKHSDQWVQLEQVSITDHFWLPQFVTDDDNLIVLSDHARDTLALFRYDTAHQRISDLIAGSPTEDIAPLNGYPNGHLAGYSTRGMQPQHHWLDPDWQHVQATVDQALPHYTHEISGNPRQRVLVFSYSDTDPGRWFLLDMTTLKMREVAEVRPSVEPREMRPMKSITYSAPDGLTIPAYLTLPADIKGPAPMVVMVHGGPIMRDTWQWNQDAQILAAHGYVVLQPQFRGSSGFGNRFKEAGYGQWGLAMQDDITAGVHSMIDQGIADPHRICIYGASFGGYAALWGLIKTPDLYQCGISFAGVTDIDFMLRDRSDTNRDKTAREWMQIILGNQPADRRDFSAVSPLQHADRIRAPVLIMHGKKDQRVPIEHSLKMIAELQRLHKPYEWWQFDDEDHGLTYIRDRAVYFEKILTFLDKYIGSPKLPVSVEGESKIPAAQH